MEAVINELQIYMNKGLQLPKCFKQHELGMNANVVSHRLRVVFNFEPVCTADGDVMHLI